MIAFLVEMLQSSILPNGYILQHLSGTLLIFSLSVSGSPSVSSSILIQDDLSWSAWANHKPVTSTELMVLESKVETVASVLNALAMLKSLEKNKNFDFFTCAEHCLSNAAMDCSSEIQGKVEFLSEQVSLIRKGNNRRRYSPSLLISCYTLLSVSTAAYHSLRDQNFLSLPSARTLSKITRSISPVTTDVDANYFSKRFSKLPIFQKYVCLIFAKRVEYSRAHKSVVGLTSDSDCARTVLVFMVKAVAGNYRDVVSMIPINRISAELIVEYFWKIIEQLTQIGFEVVATTADNHAANRKAFLHLLNGEWQPSITHPFRNLWLTYLTVCPTRQRVCYYLAYQSLLSKKLANNYFSLDHTSIYLMPFLHALIYFVLNL